MDLAPLLAQLENANLIRLAAAGPELAYLFRHGLIQDAAYATLLREQRRQWHLATAEVLEAAYTANLGAAGMAAILANHFSIAGDERRAVKYLILAADAAFDQYANAEAIDFYTQAQVALARARRAPAGMIHTERGDFDRAIAVSEEVVALGVTTGNVTVPILTRADLGRTYALLGAVDHGLALAQQALDASRQFELIAPWPKAIMVRLNVMGGCLDQAETGMAQLDDYREVIAYISAHAPSAELRASFLAQPEVAQLNH
jgi:hypothetical protein